MPQKTSASVISNDNNSPTTTTTTSTTTTTITTSTDAIIENHFQQERNTIFQQYKSLDTEHKGYVTMDDLRFALARMGLDSWNHPQLKPMIEQLMTDLTERKNKKQQQHEKQHQQQQSSTKTTTKTTSSASTNSNSSIHMIHHDEDSKYEIENLDENHLLLSNKVGSEMNKNNNNNHSDDQHYHSSYSTYYHQYASMASNGRISSSSRSPPPPPLLCLEFEDFFNLVGTKNKEGLGNVIQRAFTGQLAVPDWRQFCHEISEIFESVRSNHSGKVADYIPQLAEVDPSLFGLSICTVDGQRFSIGDSDHEFTIQSCSKVFTYCLACNDHGVDNVHQHVGFEPSGVSFNAFTLDHNNKPHNPMINAGAIAVCSLIKPELSASKRFTYMSERMSDFAGGAKIGFDNATFLSEKDTADRNYALGYYMQENEVFPKSKNSLDDTLDLYFQLCSILVTTEKLASMGATLANGGTSPLTNKNVVSPDNVKCALQLMLSCGMYDFSGEWSVSVGLPAKSGVAGACCVVIPSVMSVCIFSPRLDRKGNSVRAVDFCTKASTRFKWSIFDQLFLSAYDEEYTSSEDEEELTFSKSPQWSNMFSHRKQQEDHNGGEGYVESPDIHTPNQQEPPDSTPYTINTPHAGSVKRRRSSSNRTPDDNKKQKPTTH